MVEFNNIDKSINKGKEPRVTRQKQMETTQSTGLSQVQPIKSVEQTVEPDKIKTVREYLRPGPPTPLYQHSREP